MANSHAKTLDKDQLARLLEVVAVGPSPLVDRVRVLLSFAAGLRAQEIVGLRWDRNVLNAGGTITTQSILVTREGKKNRRFVEQAMLFVGSDIGKYGRERTIAMSPALRAAIQALKDFRDCETEPSDPIEAEIWTRLRSTPHVIPPGRNNSSSRLKSRANACVVWFNRIYEKAGLAGCSSHSGRRSFITQAARNANLQGCSLVDVQSIAGHADLGTTQLYVDMSEGQAGLVAGLWEE
jgi:integrase/recombinase XerD